MMIDNDTLIALEDVKNNKDVYELVENKQIEKIIFI